MRIVLAHNRYRQPGGEDQVFEAEGHLLERHGHEVHRYEVHNDQVPEGRALRLAASTIWNRPSYRSLGTLIAETRADVLHVHNTLPLLSPSVYYAARAHGAAVVQTLHNYRLTCPVSTHFRNGAPCEDCMGTWFPWPAVAHGCYRDSRGASAVVSTMLAAHRAMGTWSHAVDRYIALTEFAKAKFCEGGLSPERIVVKPNFLEPVPPLGRGLGDYVLFVGRLAREKGIGVLLDAWRGLGGRVPLKIVGDGPMAPDVARACDQDERITWLRHRPREEVLALMGDARLLVMPSVWYEGFPMTLLEAFAVGAPVLASDIGSLGSLLAHERTGILIEPGRSDALAQQVREAVSHPQRLRRIRREARTAFDRTYTGSRNHDQLMSVYRAAIQQASASHEREGGSQVP